MEFPKDCPIKGTPMEPVTTREWELLVKAIDELKDMMAEKLDSLHSDLSSQKNRLVGLEKDKDSIMQTLNAMERGHRWRLETIIWPIIFIVFAFLLPHFQWKP